MLMTEYLNRCLLVIRQATIRHDFILELDIAMLRTFKFGESDLWTRGESLLCTSFSGTIAVSQNLR